MYSVFRHLRYHIKYNGGEWVGVNIASKVQRPFTISFRLHVSSDPLPPTQLTVDTDVTTTSVTVKWAYDQARSHSTMWRVMYNTTKGTSNTTTINTQNAAQLKKTISGLTPGETYSVSVYGVAASDRVSQTAAQVNVTASECFIYFT